MSTELLVLQARLKQIERENPGVVITVRTGVKCGMPDGTDSGMNDSNIRRCEHPIRHRGKHSWDVW